MIWAFEYFLDEDIERLSYLNPLMDIRFEYPGGNFSYQTIWVGHENGREIRRIRTHGIKNTRQGFICDDWLEAIKLSHGMATGGFEGSSLLKSYPWLNDYFLPRKDNMILEYVVMPIKTYIDFLSHNPKMLENVDLDDLLKY